MAPPSGAPDNSGKEHEPASSTDELVAAIQHALQSAEELGREILLQARTQVDLTRERIDDKVESTVASLFLALFSAGLALSISLLLARGFSALLSSALGTPGAGDLAAAGVLAGLWALAFVLRRRRRRAKRIAELRTKYDSSVETHEGEPA